MTLIIIGLLYSSIHNSFIANQWIEVKFVQRMMCAMYVHYAFQMFIYFGGPKEWQEKLTPCKPHLLMHLTQTCIMSPVCKIVSYYTLFIVLRVCRIGHHSYSNNITLGLRSAIHISSTRNKWMLCYHNSSKNQWLLFPNRFSLHRDPRDS